MKPMLNTPFPLALPKSAVPPLAMAALVLAVLVVGAMVVGAMVVGAMAAPAYGVTVETLRAPITDLKNTIFGGWMWIAKIGAAVGGCVMAVYQRDIIPLATGAAVGLGIHFYDGYFGNPAAGALI